MRRWRERQARERVRKALQQQQQQGSSTAVGQRSTWDAEAGLGASSSSSGGDHGRDPGAGVCVVCLSAPSEMVYVKCGHMCCCSKCVATLGSSRKCPVCRTEGNVIKVFRT
jgi:E3 ubiquitin-protein ligase MUL1